MNIALLLTLFSLNTFAISHALIVGGAVEGNDRENQFFREHVTSAKLLKGYGWSIDVLYGDQRAYRRESYACANSQTDCAPISHTWDPTRVARDIGLSPQTIQESSITNFLAKLDTYILSFPADGQLMIIFNSHGTSANRSGGHAIAFSDGNLLVSDHRLTSRLQQLKDRGVKLAFMDDSCNSGESVPTFSQYGCSIASTSNTIGYTLSGSLWAMSWLLSANHRNFRRSTDLPSPENPHVPDRKVTLEEVYLYTLFFSNNHYRQFPVISAMPSSYDFGRDWIRDLYINSANNNPYRFSGTNVAKMLRYFNYVKDLLGPMNISRYTAYIQNYIGHAHSNLRNDDISEFLDLINESDYMYFYRVLHRFEEERFSDSELNRTLNQLRRSATQLAESSDQSNQAQRESEFALTQGQVTELERRIRRDRDREYNTDILNRMSRLFFFMEYMYYREHVGAGQGTPEEQRRLQECSDFALINIR